MQTLIDIACTLLIAFVLWDVFITVFSPGGAGPLTGFWTERVWKSLLVIHRQRPIHRLLALAGPHMLLCGILLWYTLSGAGLFFLLSAHPESVVTSITGKQADMVQKLYFVGTTITSLGYGDLVPQSAPWSVICTLFTLAGTIVLTISLSYVLSVLMASVERRRTAHSIYGLTHGK